MAGGTGFSAFAVGTACPVAMRAGDKFAHFDFFLYAGGYLFECETNAYT